MLDFRPNLQVPFVLSFLCILLSQVQAQSTPPECAILCGDIAATQTGCAAVSVFQFTPTTLQN